MVTTQSLSFSMATWIFYKAIADLISLHPCSKSFRKVNFETIFVHSTYQHLLAINSLQSLTIGNLSSNMCCIMDQCTALLTQHVFLCSACQQQLPATGVPITRQRFDHMRQKFREYVQAQTLQNWKFWIVSF